VAQILATEASNDARYSVAIPTGTASDNPGEGSDFQTTNQRNSLFWGMCAFSRSWHVGFAPYGIRIRSGSLWTGCTKERLLSAYSVRGAARDAALLRKRSRGCIGYPDRAGMHA
jgi:hypothetical protein